MSTIYFFRHGQTDFNLKKVFTGHLQSNLTEEGLKQAYALSQTLSKKIFNLAYTSPLIRCQKTLEIVLEKHPECRETKIDDRLLERSYGDLAGKFHADIIEKYGQEQFDKWHRGWSDRPPGGESFADVEVRVRSFLDDLKKEYAGQNLGIAICSSGNTIRLARKILENATIEDCISWTIPYDQVFEYQI